MTLRDRCKELVREWRETAGVIERNSAAPHYDARAMKFCSHDLQSALDAAEGEALDAARYRWVIDFSHEGASHAAQHAWELFCGNSSKEVIDAAIDAAMKESKP